MYVAIPWADLLHHHMMNPLKSLSKLHVCMYKHTYMSK